MNRTQRCSDFGIVRLSDVRFSDVHCKLKMHPTGVPTLKKIRRIWGQIRQQYPKTEQKLVWNWFCLDLRHMEPNGTAIFIGISDDNYVRKPNCLTTELEFRAPKSERSDFSALLYIVQYKTFVRLSIDHVGKFRVPKSESSDFSALLYIVQHKTFVRLSIDHVGKFFATAHRPCQKQTRLRRGRFQMPAWSGLTPWLDSWKNNFKSLWTCMLPISPQTRLPCLVRFDQGSSL